MLWHAYYHYTYIEIGTFVWFIMEWIINAYRYYAARAVYMAYFHMLLVIANEMFESRIHKDIQPRHFDVTKSWNNPGSCGMLLWYSSARLHERPVEVTYAVKNCCEGTMLPTCAYSLSANAYTCAMFLSLSQSSRQLLWSVLNQEYGSNCLNGKPSHSFFSRTVSRLSISHVCYKWMTTTWPAEGGIMFALEL